MLRPDDKEEEREVIKAEHLHSPTVHQKSSPVPTRDESETRRNNEREDLTTKRRESDQDKTKHSPFSWNSSPLEMNPSPKGNNDGKASTTRRGGQSRCCL